MHFKSPMDSHSYIYIHISPVRPSPQGKVTSREMTWHDTIRCAFAQQYTLPEKVQWFSFHFHICAEIHHINITLRTFPIVDLNIIAKWVYEHILPRYQIYTSKVHAFQWSMILMNLYIHSHSNEISAANH